MARNHFPHIYRPIEIGSMTIVEDSNYRGKVNLDEMPWPLVSRFLPGILEWGLKPWVLYSDSFDFSNLYNSFEITVPSTYTVFLNGTQLGEEYGAMETDRGKTRGKFTELVFDVKHDAWVIPQYSHGILLIVDSEETTGTPALNVRIVDDGSSSTTTEP